MRTGIDKSKVMKRAWDIFRGNNPYSHSFSDALRRAWEVEGAWIAYEEEKAAKEAERARLEAWRASAEYKAITENAQYCNTWNAGITAYYANANARTGQYMGD